MLDCGSKEHTGTETPMWRLQIHVDTATFPLHLALLTISHDFAHPRVVKLANRKTKRQFRPFCAGKSRAQTNEVSSDTETFYDDEHLIGSCRLAVLHDIYDGIYGEFKRRGVFCYCMPVGKHETALEYEDRVMTSLAPCANFNGLPWAALVLHEGLLELYAKEAQDETSEPWEYACAVVFVDGTRCVCDADECKGWIVATALESLAKTMARPLPDRCSCCGEFLICGHHGCPSNGCSGFLCLPCLSNGMRRAMSSQDVLKVLHPWLCARICA